MTKHTYRLTRRYRDWPAGREVELDEDAAIRINNEAPGALERIEQDAPKPAKPIAAPTVKADI